MHKSYRGMTLGRRWEGKHLDYSIETVQLHRLRPTPTHTKNGPNVRKSSISPLFIFTLVEPTFLVGLLALGYDVRRYDFRRFQYYQYHHFLFSSRNNILEITERDRFEICFSCIAFILCFST